MLSQCSQGHDSLIMAFLQWAWCKISSSKSQNFSQRDPPYSHSNHLVGTFVAYHVSELGTRALRNAPHHTILCQWGHHTVAATPPSCGCSEWCHTNSLYLLIIINYNITQFILIKSFQISRRKPKWIMIII